MLLLLAAGAWRRRRAGAAAAPAPAPDPAPLPEPAPTAPMALGPACAIALPAAVVIAGVFGLRAGAVAAPLLVLLLWRGVADRLLALAVLGLLGVVVPLIYVGVAIFGDLNASSGNATRFAPDRLAAHWVAAGAFVLLVVLLWRSLAAARARRRAADERHPVPSSA
jgi:hypothetical protein